MTISAKVIAKTSNPFHPKHVITSMQVRYPRFIHAEVMTHRVFSRNASSSRAIPVQKLIDEARNESALPERWGRNQRGMQAGAEVDDPDEAKRLWLAARDASVHLAQEMADQGLHKQIPNRILEPFTHISVIITATEWDNFFALRCHPDADPTMEALANAMRDEMDSVRAMPSFFHFPYLTSEECEGRSYEDNALISAARCARVSYLTHDKKEPSLEQDQKLADMLLSSKHMSPFEHQALASKTSDWSGNFQGWRQFRKEVENRE